MLDYLSWETLVYIAYLPVSQVIAASQAPTTKEELSYPCVKPLQT